MEKPTTLVIGLGQTVGGAIAQRFLAEGHNVLAVDPNQALLDELSKTIGSGVPTYHGPIHTRLGLRNSLAAALEAFGRVDNIICTPALPEPDQLLDLDTDAFEENLLSAVGGAIKTLRVFSDEMVSHSTEPGAAVDRTRQNGSFTFVLSLGALLSQPGWFSESVTQAAILALVRSASVELSDLGVRVNAIVALRPRAEGIESWLKERTPAHRAALAEEIAEAAAFLSNPGSAIVTGECLTLDGARRNLSGLMPLEED